MNTFWIHGIGRYVLRHPSGVVPLLFAVWKLRRNGWWHRAPFLPVPDPHYWAFRINTVVGSEPLKLSPGVVVEAAKWSMSQRRGR
jgi:hypothetical protein